MSRSFAFALLAYSIWGFVPLYWKYLNGISASELITHRVAWSFAFLILLMRGTKRDFYLFQPWKKRNLLLLGSSLLISFNWFLYIFAVNSGHTLEGSLGYFINPLLNVFLGVLFLRERLTKLQWAAIAIAATGVLLLLLNTKIVLWISLLLALSFSLYGFTRKKLQMDTISATTVETGIALLPAILLFISLWKRGELVFTSLSTGESLAVIGSGIVTTVPLLLFAEAAKHLSLSTLGFLQYVAPSLQMICAVIVFHEPFGWEHGKAFALIWVALLIYSFSMIRRRSLLNKGP